MTFTIEQIRKYLNSQDSLGDIHHNLSEENILKANVHIYLCTRDFNYMNSDDNTLLRYKEEDEITEEEYNNLPQMLKKYFTLKS